MATRIQHPARTAIARGLIRKADSTEKRRGTIKRVKGEVVSKREARCLGLPDKFCTRLGGKDICQVVYLL